MNDIIVCLFIVLSLLFIPFPVKSQTKPELNFGADLVSSYVWRGYKQAGASIQPHINVGVNEFSLIAWGSTDIAGEGKKEVDFTLSYEKLGFKASITDYWWDGEGQYRYFSSPQGGNTGHYLEGSLGYTISKAFPLNISWNTFFLGKGNKKTDGENSYSTYIELAYPFSINNTDLSLGIGFIPWNSAVYGTAGFRFTSLTLTVSRSIKFTDSFSLPIFSSIICNPAQEDIHFVFGISVKLND